MPENSKYAAELPGVFNQAPAAPFSFKLGQVQPVMVEQRPILNVQRELEECPRAEWAKHLRGSVAVPDSLVVPRGGIVGVTALIEGGGRIRIVQQPVHPDAN